MIVLETPKGWTGPKVVDGVQVEGTFRAHQVPLSEIGTKPGHLKMLEDWMKSYKPGRAVRRERRADSRARRAGARRDHGAWAPIHTPTAACC